MAYSDSETFDLGNVGAPELFVTYERPGMLSYKKSQEWFKRHLHFNEKRSSGSGQQTIQEFLQDTDAEFQWIMSLVTSWNLKNQETGEPLLTPKENPAVWSDIAGVYLLYIVKYIKDDPTGADFLTKGLQGDFPMNLNGDRILMNTSQS